MLIKEAKGRGVDRIVVTHAMLSPVSMTVAQMKEAAALGAYLEFVSNAVIGMNKEFEPKVYADAIRAVGVEHCILSSDFGQAGNPLHPDGLQQIFALLRQAGLSSVGIDRIAKKNPARLLRLE